MKKSPHASQAMRSLMLPCLLAAASALPACSSTKEPDNLPPTPPSAQSSLPPEIIEEGEPAQINSNRPMVIEYDGDDRDSGAPSGQRGGWGQLDEDLGGAGMDLSPMAGWIRN